jgi:hypothetical protein
MTNYNRPPCASATLSLGISTILVLSMLANPGATNSEQNDTSVENQNIIFADLHLIQAIRDILENNYTGAVDQVELAKGQLERALGSQQ